MNESHDREIIGAHLLVIGGAEDKYNERRILKRFLVVKINLDRHRRWLLAETRTDKNQDHSREQDSTLSHLRISPPNGCDLFHHLAIAITAVVIS